MKHFINIEIQNLRTLRKIVLSILLLINFGLLGFFIYSMYDAYQDRNLPLGFLSYSLPTILYIQLALALLFAALIWIIHRRFRFILFEMNDLKEEYAMLYQDYCNSVPRMFSTLPQYLFSQKGLLVFNNLKRVTILPKSIESISIRRMDMGRFGKKCDVQILESNSRTTKMSFASIYPEEVEFLKQHIRLVNTRIAIYEEA